MSLALSTIFGAAISQYQLVDTFRKLDQAAVAPLIRYILNEDAVDVITPNTNLGCILGNESADAELVAGAYTEPSATTTLTSPVTGNWNLYNAVKTYYINGNELAMFIGEGADITSLEGVKKGFFEKGFSTLPTYVNQRLVSGLLRKIELGLVQSQTVSGLTTVALEDIVSSSGPGTDVGGANLTSLTINERPWYVVPSGGTGAVSDAGYTYTGSATIGKAEAMKWVMAIAEGRYNVTGLALNAVLINPNDYNELRTAYDAVLTKTYDAIKKAAGKQKGPNAKPLEYYLTYRSEESLRVPGPAGPVVFIPTARVPAGSLWVVNIGEGLRAGVALSKGLHEQAWKKITSKMAPDFKDLGGKPFISFAVKPEAATSSGFGHGLVMEGRLNMGWRLLEAAAVNYISFDSSVA